MRMRLVKGLERGDRCDHRVEEGQELVTDGIKDDKRVRKQGKKRNF